jgi:hypothetical protein
MLYVIGEFDELFPNAWQSFILNLVPAKGIFTKDFIRYPLIVRVFTTLGPRDFPLTLVLHPPN